MPTATNDNQNPACRKAHGSHRVTATAANNHTMGQGHRRPDTLNAVNTTNMTTVRWAGTPQPAKTAYSQAATAPPMRAASGEGTRHANLPVLSQSG